MDTQSGGQRADIAKKLDLGAGPTRKRRALRWLVRIAALAIVAGLCIPWLMRDKGAATRYETKPVKRGDLVVTVSATGTLQPIKEVDVGIEVSGTVKSVDVDYNDHVEVGQVLARLDTTKLEAQVLQSEASLESARAKLLQAQATVQEAEAQMARLAEMRKLSDGKLPSSYDYDAQKAALARAKADEASAKAAVSQAQATLDAGRTDLGKAVIHSPVNGVVLTRDVEPGQTVAATLQAPVLFSLAEDLTKMQLQVDVDEADVGSVAEGQEATFTVDAYPERTFPARVTQVRFGGETTDNVVTYKTVLSVDNSELILRPGMTATAVITVQKVENALLVPNAALRFTPPQTKPAESSGGTNLLSAIMPHPPRHETKQIENPNDKKKEQSVWVLRDAQLTAIQVTKGLSDGIMTAVAADGLEPGVELVTGSVTTASQ